MNIDFRAAISIAVVASLCFATKTHADQIRYKVDGWCLAHNRGDIAPWPENPLARGRIPLFRAPSGFELLGAEVPEGETGLLVSYSKRHAYSRARAAASDGGPGRRGCSRHPVGNGLLQLVGDGVPECSVQSTYEWQNDQYEPAVRDDVFGAVQISCGRSQAVLACRMTDILPNGWKATITLPKEHLAEWKMAARVAQNFFEENLTDCGEE